MPKAMKKIVLDQSFRKRLEESARLAVRRKIHERAQKEQAIEKRVFDIFKKHKYMFKVKELPGVDVLMNEITDMVKEVLADNKNE